MLAVPVHIRGELIGVLLHKHLGAARRWSVDEQLFAMAIAAAAAAGPCRRNSTGVPRKASTSSSL